MSKRAEACLSGVVGAMPPRARPPCGATPVLTAVKLLFAAKIEVKNIQKKTKQRIDKINNILSQYGSMTLRQIYYRLLSVEGYNYRQIMYGCSLGRRKGLIDFSLIVDRSRPVYGSRLFQGFKDFMMNIADYFHLDYWIDSKIRPAVWTEKDALSQILFEEAEIYNVSVYVTRGFLSLSNMVRWGGNKMTILYFGDFDPSGLFIDKRLRLEAKFKNLKRIALTWDQIHQHDLPSVPVKRSDPRAPIYIAEYGQRGWELDALDPKMMRQLVRNSIEEYVDFDLEQKREEELEIRRRLKKLAEESV